MDIAPTSGWHPVARSAELVPGHVFHARLLGQELALWRDAAGNANAWENRCPHRGVRLSVGTNLGSELRCLYHGLRYASGTAKCTVVPSMQAALPPQFNLCAKAFPVTERYGFTWVTLGEPAGAPAVPRLDDAPSLTLRSVVIAAAAERVRDALRHYHDAVLFVQPADAHKAVVHGAVVGEFDADAARRIRVQHNAALCELRDAIEAGHVASRARDAVGMPDPVGAR
jgi:phenylpropionate dioxygenase-like ring-hydroxylating dioxygenase large terminal subunit